MNFNALVFCLTERDYATNAEVQRITDHIDQRFNKLEAKIDQLIQSGR